MRAPRKYLIVLFFMTAVGAGHAVPLHAQTQQTECPPECTIDTMEIVTWYPSPYNEYEELRLYPTQRDPGDCDNDKIGLMYYDHGGTPSFPEDDKMRVCKGISLGWQEVGGGVDVRKINMAGYTVGFIAGYTEVLVNGVSYAVPYYEYCDTSNPICAFLVYNQHTGTDCESAGGAFVLNGAERFCRFTGSSCPSGWTQYQNWSTTVPHSYGHDQVCSGFQDTCTTGSHSTFSNVSPETCSFNADKNQASSCGQEIGSAVISSIGCY